MHDSLTIQLGLVLVLGVVIQVFAWRFRIPSILGLAVIGLLLGPVFGLVSPSEQFGPLFEPMVKLAVAIILFEGGLSLRLHELKEAGSGVLRLITLNSLLTFLLVGGIAHYFLELGWGITSIIAAILIVTGPTVIIPMLRNAKLPRKLNTYLKWEGIVNDPIGVLLAILLLEYVTFTQSEGGAIILFFKNLSLAIVTSVGLVAAVYYLITRLLEKGQMPQYLKLPIILAAVIVVYTIPNLIQAEAGLLATTLFGIRLGKADLPIIDELRRFKEYLTILLIPMVFILLAADVDYEAIKILDFKMVGFLLLLLFVVRPISVFLSNIRSDMTLKEKFFVSLIAPRGIVSAALADLVAIRLTSAEYPQAEVIVPLIYLVIFGSVTLNSLFINVLSNKLGIAEHGDKILVVGSNAWTVDLCGAIRKLKIPVLIADSSHSHLMLARLYRIPTHHGEVLSEIIEEDLDLTNLGHVVAATENDAYNSLVCTRYLRDLGDDRVHQIPFRHEGEQSFKKSYQGMFLVEESFTYETLLRNHYNGWIFDTLSVDKDNFQRMVDLVEKKECFPILAKQVSGKVRFNSVQAPIKLAINEEVIFYHRGSLDLCHSTEQQTPT